MTIERLDLRNSGDTAGPKDRVVGYGAWALYEDTQRARIEAAGSELIALARQSILAGLATGAPAPVTIDQKGRPLLTEPGAAFVTLRRSDGALRGCIGSAVATRPLMVDVTQHAFNAAFRDPRFPRLDWLELPGLSLSVSVLTPPEPMRFADESDLLQQLRPGTDGLIIADLGRRALFLPSVWEELPDPRQFLALLKLKAGMSDVVSATLRAQRFRSIEVKGTMVEGSGAAFDRLGWRVLG
jgi:AmmeMemoRadiSam system protein A